MHNNMQHGNKMDASLYMCREVRAHSHYYVHIIMEARQVDHVVSMASPKCVIVGNSTKHLLKSCVSGGRS